MKETTRRQSMLSTLAVMAGTLGSRILGFVRIALISMYFGASGEADILNAVFNIPNNFRKLLAEGALSSAFIPELSKQIVADPKGPASRNLSRSILGLQLLILIPLSLVCVFFPEIILKIFIRFPEPWKLEMAVRLFRWIFHYILLISVSAVLMAVLNSHNHFLIPALSPLLFSISVISSIVIWHDSLGIFSMVIGVLGGGVAQIIWQYPKFHKLGYSLIPRLHFKDESFRRVMKQWLPVLVTSSIFTVNQMIAVFLATGLDEGSTTALSNAIVFWQLPFGIFSASIATVLFPKMSRQAGEGNHKGMASTLQQGIHMLSVLLVPSSILLMIFGPELISTALQRGEYDAANSHLAAQVLFAYAPGMFFVGSYNLFQRSFYSRGNFKFPLKTALVTVLLDIILSLLFIRMGKGVVSLAWANSIAFVFGALMMATGSFRENITLDFGYLGKQTFKVFAAQIPMVAAALFMKHFISVSMFYEGSGWKNFGFLAIEGIISLGVLFFFYSLMKLDVMTILKRRGSK
ncbi:MULTISPECIES: murein biosynthesis integral membrane protein MurJ [unclassified Oceanispirochaeta]|uniref:murein biosynthesis integral membrane protein MurJ n=1 Tax=unclassified Oceanispirochaeta TaxID=2635722 RepID=UPI0011C02777|nr:MULTISPECIES: murein biosynthesis integral membrane protein MurJ [unclassified Oceanispirochaeta]MBF9017235.1 murein biosynthesis integral membrane protein MurJ [Oceanispirochaeta sp. M2]NPD73684.1 murein biosynthesis integral membrane protein MurJ [Oceanispirochaeta sp. M1]